MRSVARSIAVAAFAVAPLLVVGCTRALRVRPSPALVLRERPPVVAESNVWRFDPRRTQFVPTVAQDTIVVESGPEGARFLSGVWRFELDANGALSSAGALPARAWAAAWREGTGWLLLARDGTLFRSDSFLSDLSVLGRMDRPVDRVARVEPERFAIDDAGNLWAFDPRGPFLLLRSPHDPIDAVAMSGQGALFARRRGSHRWLRRAPSSLAWVPVLGWTRELGDAIARMNPEHRWVRGVAIGERADARPDPLSNPAERVEARWARALLEASMEPLSGVARRVGAPLRERPWLREPDAPVAPNNALMASDTSALFARASDEHCVAWRSGTSRCLLTPMLTTSVDEPSNEPRERGACVFAWMTARCEMAACPLTAFLARLCEHSTPTLSRLPVNAWGFEFFDERRGVAWGYQLRDLWKTDDGGARWTRWSTKLSIDAVSYRTVRIADPSRGVLFRDGLWLSADDLGPPAQHRAR